MSASILPRLMLFGVASILVLAAPAAMAQTEGKPQAPAKAETTAKTGEKSGAGAKKPAKPGGACRATRPRPRREPIARAMWFGWIKTTSSTIRAPANMAASPAPSPARRASLRFPRRFSNSMHRPPCWRRGQVFPLCIMRGQRRELPVTWSCQARRLRLSPRSFSPMGAAIM